MARVKDQGLEPQIKVYDPISDIKEKFDFYIKIVIGILVVAVLTMLFMVGGLLLDSWHFNSVIYKEYSDKNDVLKSTQDNNKILLETIKQNQEIMEKLLNKQNNQ